MINLNLRGQDRLLAWLLERQKRIDKALAKTMGELTGKLAERVREKLSGQVLNIRSRKLLNSIETTTESRASFFRGQVGSRLAYAAAHELGFDGVVTVREHLRMQVKAFGKTIKNPHPVSVRAHPMHMKLPERSFLRNALHEMSPQILSEIEACIKEATQ